MLSLFGTINTNLLTISHQDFMFLGQKSEILALLLLKNESYGYHLQWLIFLRGLVEFFFCVSSAPKFGARLNIGSIRNTYNTLSPKIFSFRQRANKCSFIISKILPYHGCLMHCPCTNYKIFFILL